MRKSKGGRKRKVNTLFNDIGYDELIKHPVPKIERPKKYDTTVQPSAGTSALIEKQELENMFINFDANQKKLQKAKAALEKLASMGFVDRANSRDYILTVLNIIDSNN